MSLEYIREYYKVDAYKGRRIHVKDTGNTGRIIGAHGAYVLALMDRDSRKRKWIFHPLDLVYHDEGEA